MKPNVAGMGPQFKIMVRIQNAGDSLSDIPLVMSRDLPKWYFRGQETCEHTPTGDSVNKFDNLVQFKSNNPYRKQRILGQKGHESHRFFVVRGQ